jgi:NADH:ubiquinone oxidoreductase subunit K
VRVRVAAAAAIILGRQGHVANWFIQLEVVSLLIVYLVFVESAGAGLAPFIVIMIFTALASEGAIGLAVIVKNRRGSRAELLKSQF